MFAEDEAGTLVFHELKPKDPNGNIEVGFKRALANGTTGIELKPMALMRRLASLVPPPGNHDTCYFGVFAPNAKRRSRLVRGPEKIREGLEKLGLWSEAPPLAKARRPPQVELFERRSDADGIDPPPPDFAA